SPSVLLMNTREPSNPKLSPPACRVLALLVVIACAAFAQAHRRQAAPSPAPAAAPPPSANEIVRRAMEHDVSNWEKETNYTFVQRIEQRELNSDGTVKSTKSETEEIIFLYGQPYAHLIHRNDRPLSDSE